MFVSRTSRHHLIVLPTLELLSNVFLSIKVRDEGKAAKQKTHSVESRVCSFPEPRRHLLIALGIWELALASVQ